MSGFYPLCYGLLGKFFISQSDGDCLISSCWVFFYMKYMEKSCVYVWNLLKVTRKLVSVNIQNENTKQAKNSELYEIVLKHVSICPCCLRTAWLVKLVVKNLCTKRNSSQIVASSIYFQLIFLAASDHKKNPNMFLSILYEIYTLLKIFFLGGVKSWITVFFSFQDCYISKVKGFYWYAIDRNSLLLWK